MIITVVFESHILQGDSGGHLGWDDFFCQSTTCPVLLGQMEELAGQLGKIMEHPNQSQPNPIRDHQSLPAVLNSFLKVAILQKMYRRRERPQQQQHCIT